MPQRVSLDFTNASHDVHREDMPKERQSATSLGLDDHTVDALEPKISKKKTSFGIDSIIITPSYMEFKDGADGVLMKQILTFQNVGNKAATITINTPNSMSFEIDPVTEYRLCPGLSLTRLVRYIYKVHSSFHAMIPVEINGRKLDYHLICGSSVPRITVEPVVLDFGYVDIGSMSDIKQVTIYNTGGKTARFSVDLGLNTKDLDVQPRRGIVFENGKAVISIQIAGIREGVQYKEFWIKSNPNASVSLTVDVIRPKMIIDYPLTENAVSLFDFSTSFLNTHKCIECTLQNFSAQKRSFIIFHDENGRLASVEEINRKYNPTFDAFDIQPLQGTLQPFEKIKLTVNFRPTIETLTLLQHQLKSKHVNCFLAVINLCKVKACEAKEVMKTKTNVEMANEKRLSKIFLDDLFVKEEPTQPVDEQATSEAIIYLHAKVELAHMLFEPDELYLPELNVDEKIERRILAGNPSKELSFEFTFTPKPCVRCSPAKGRLRPRQITELLISIKADYNLETPIMLEFNLWTDCTSGANMVTKKRVNLGKCTLLCRYTLLKARGKRKEAFCKLSAAPKLAREPDYSLTYTTSELRLINEHKQYWSDYFRSVFSRKPKDEEQSSCSFGSKFDEFCDISNLQRKIKPSAQQYDRKELERYLQQNHTISHNKEIPSRLTPLQIYKVHVKPTKLDFGKMALRANKRLNITFKNCNDFPVTIGLISLHPNWISFPDANKIVLQSKATVSRAVQFHSDLFGKNKIYINYTINNYLRYQLPVLVNVVPKNLKLITKEISFEKEAGSQEDYDLPFKVIEILNEININIKFKWSLSDLASFKIKPIAGEVSGGRRLRSAIYPCPDAAPVRAEAILSIEGGLRRALSVEAARAARRVFLVPAHLEMGVMPLNRECRFKSVLCNAEFFQTHFEVDEDSLPYGVEVLPMSGLLPPRSVVVLDVCMNISTCVKFDSFINVVVQKSLVLELKISGEVIYPRVKIIPSVIEMKRISSSSYQVREIVATNTTCCCVGLKFPMEDYPEFQVSRSSSRSDRLIEDEEIDMLPRETVQLYLHFRPCELACYSFYLPMVINGIIGPVDIQDRDTIGHMAVIANGQLYSEWSGCTVLPIPETLTLVHINSTVTSPTICMNKLWFEFDNDVKQDIFCVCNNTGDNLTFTLVTESVTSTMDCPFRFCWHNDERIKRISPVFTNNSISCELRPDDKLCVKITLCPRLSGNYVFGLPINLKKDDEEIREYNTLVLSGSYVTESIETDALEVYLAPVLINVLVKERFSLRLRNFPKACRLAANVSPPLICSGEFGDQALLVNFPDGASVTPNSSQEIPVEIRFKSLKTVSFCVYVTFAVSDYPVTARVLVYGSADNCVLSTYAHHKVRLDNFVVTRRRPCPAEDMSVSLSEDDAAELYGTRNQITGEKKRHKALIYSHSSCYSDMDRRASRRDRYSSFNRQSMFMAHYKEPLSDYELAVKTSRERAPSITVYHPFFPMVHTVTHRYGYVYEVMYAVENWFYAQVLRYQFNPIILEGITLALSKIDEPLAAADKGNDSLEPCSFFDILLMLSDSVEMRRINEILKEACYSSDEERVTQVLDSYKQAILYLMSQGACIAHVSPEFLIDYDDYLTSKGMCTSEEISMCGDYVLAECSFWSRSKQAWLDMFLQTYKCFVLSQVSQQTLEQHATAIRSSKAIKSWEHVKCYDLNVRSIIQRARNYEHKSKSEAILLAWLEYCHNKVFDERSVVDFGHCLSDGLVLIAATIFYCPFLKSEFFHDLFLRPVNANEKTHNLVCLVLAWKKIRLGFIITPAEFLHENGVQMLLLAVHLFKYLPTYLLRTKVVFSCPLTQSTSQKIKLPIPQELPANYVVQFVDNNRDLFSAKAVLALPAEKAKFVKVTYHARKIMNVSVYMILCGMAIGPDFGENQVFLLEGSPNELVVSDEHAIRTKLYHITEKHLDVSILRDYITEYEIWLSDELPQSPDDLKITRWAELRLERIPRRLFINRCKLKVHEDSETTELPITIYCMTCEPQTFYVFFRSFQADFIIQITSSCKNSTTDTVTVAMENEACICGDNPDRILEECPLNKKIFIQSKNTQLQNCFVQSFLKSLSPNECSFWNQYLNNITGLRLIGWMIKNFQESIASEFNFVFEPKVTFNVTFSKKSNVLVFPRTVTVEDITCDDDKIELNIHVPEVNRELTSVLVTLTSADKKDIRVCKVNFTYRESTPEVSKQQSKNNKYSKNVVKTI